MTSRLAYTTDTVTAAEMTRREREGVLAACSRCERVVRWYVAVLPAEPVCGRCEDWG